MQSFDAGGAALVEGASFGGAQPPVVGLGGCGVLGRGAFGGIAARIAVQGVPLAGRDEPVSAGCADVFLAVVAGVVDDGADAAGHHGVAGGDVVAGFAPGGAGAQAVVAGRQLLRVAGVGGVRGGHDGGALAGDSLQPGRLPHVAGVLAGVPAGHQPVIGGGVLAVVALLEPAAADGHQPRVRVGDIPHRLGGRLPRVRVPASFTGFTLCRGLGEQLIQPGAGGADGGGIIWVRRAAAYPRPGAGRAAALPVIDQRLPGGGRLVRPDLLRRHRHVRRGPSGDGAGR